ncbi:C4-dicarboxylate transport transcriptional regulatory protein DctD [Thalassovita autumnalis]|uniref:C4-dicarboxylate transport transcriptional regulatory protein DctD n=1 Tax=Thalassovita autumnalis TaxID=2072972 RepID=A0A0P1FVJ6_9RHOB|nr:sigma-54 dependent transcriptional regulator [Thalassovita autumnalis]CUH69614.1 C4-dicarboxylate transport transcriptional regulatory protein DctD [Thalassovita autumnalis]CUH73017.1 C4-dicarboxylate transport transcriptional regulatory protein DctD [Thalassovita autumnalis]
MSEALTIRKVLLVDDDAAVRDALAQTLELADLTPLSMGSFIEAKDHIGPDFDGVVLSDIRMPGRDGFHLLDYTQDTDAELPVILLTGEGDIPMAVKAMRNGAFGFLEKPCASADLLAALERALKTRALVLENRRMKAQLETGDAAARMLYGQSDLSEVLRARARLAARAGTDVLVNGAPGSGIYKVAEVIHLCSPNAKGPFVKRAAPALDRAALAEALEAAQGGTLFLDDIGGLAADAQIALIDALEAGGVRLIAGSTQDLSQAVEQGLLQAEIYYRVEVMMVRIPSLKERPEDIPVLFRHYVAQAAEQSGLEPPEVTPEVISSLMTRDWPGNARALMSAAMRFVLGEGSTEDDAETELGLAEQMARVERSLLIAALRRAEGRASNAAQALKLPRKTFYDKLARYGVKPEDFR